MEHSLQDSLAAREANAEYWDTFMGDNSNEFMEIRKIDCDFTVCKVGDYSLVDLNTKFCFVGSTDEEMSLVCPTNKVPPNIIEKEDYQKAIETLENAGYKVVE